jgi:hypothetical protein
LPSAAGAAPIGARSASSGRALVVLAQMSGCLPRLGRPIRVLGQRPVSGVRCDRPVSARAMPTRPVSNVRVWTSGVPRPCPVSGVDVRRPASVSARSASASAVSARSASASAVSAPVASWSASVRWAATRPGGAWVWPSGRIRERLGHLPEPELGPLSRRRPCRASGDIELDLAVGVGGTRAAGQVRPPGRPGTSRLRARTARRSGNSIRAVLICSMAAQVVRACLPASSRP